MEHDLLTLELKYKNNEEVMWLIRELDKVGDEESKELEEALSVINEIRSLV